MSTAVLRSEDALKSRFHANAFGYRPTPTQRPPMNPRRRQPPPPPRSAAPAAPAPSPSPATSPPLHKSNRAGPAPPSRSSPPKADRPAPGRAGRKSRPAPAGKENDCGAADELRRHRRRLVMEEVTILKRGEAMKPSAPVLPASRSADPSISPTVPIDLNPEKLGFPAVDPVYAGPGFSVFSPPPSSVPYPSFLLTPLAASEEATRSLLRLLRLNQFAP